MSESSGFDPAQITRPDKKLFQYYLWIALLTGPLSPIIFLTLYFRYQTLRYKFDESGVSMAWGILFKREIYLTYRRIQDIHLTRNILQRWMGLAKISLQTASGSSQAEMGIEGILQAEELRDYLYSRMRGAKDDSGSVDSNEAMEANARADEVTTLLTEIRDSLRQNANLDDRQTASARSQSASVASQSASAGSQTAQQAEDRESC